MKTNRSLGIGLVLALAAAAMAADDLPKGETVLDKYVEATGGKAVYSKIHNETTTGTMEFKAMGLKGKLTSYAAEPDKRYTEISLEGIGKIQEGDLIEIVIDRVKLEGSVNLVNGGSAAEGSRLLAARPPRPDLAPDPALPPETRLWAALQDVSGGTWGGCVFDPAAITTALKKQ